MNLLDKDMVFVCSYPSYFEMIRYNPTTQSYWFLERIPICGPSLYKLTAQALQP